MTERASDAPPEPSGAERLLLDHLARRARGEASDFEALCAVHADSATELRELSARWELVARVLPDVHGDDTGGRGAAAAGFAPDHVLALLARLSSRAPVADRYGPPVEVARGAQGTIMDVFDADLQRHVAQKVLHGGAARPGEAPGGGSGPRSLGRFLDEAQVTARLEHPGIVPVHELGLDAEGRLFFTMKLVRGRSLQQLLQSWQREPRQREAAGSARGSDEAAGWTTTRVLGALLRVAEAMAFAHDRGVIHRDLKPSNVMLGGYGEVYVMDWGLARILGSGGTGGRSERAPGVRGPPESKPGSGTSLLTLEGDVVGTPHYMSPEQAAGRLGDVGPRSDVYALGAMLYHVLAGQAPYASAGTDARPDGGSADETPSAIVLRVRAGPPRALRDVVRVPAELEAICEKAMARDPAQRYAGMGEFATDLRAFLESRVVRAYETGALAELRKWVRRNRALTLTSALALLALVGGLLYASRVEAAGRALAEAETRRADQSLASLLRLSDRERLTRLRSQADGLWPAFPAQIAAMQAWLADARDLVGRTDQHRATLDELRSRAAPCTAADAQHDLDTFPGAAELVTQRIAVKVRQNAADREQADPASDEETRLAEVHALQEAQKRLAGMEERRVQRRTWVFAATEDAWWHATLSDLMDGLQDFATVTLPAVEQRLARAESLERISLREPAAAWEQALSSIADAQACPSYGGLRLQPQLGLVPLGRDPHSGLWEFCDVQLGELPARNADGSLRIAPETGVVFVLLPGGTFAFGGQSTDPAAPNYDRWADPQFNRVQQVRLDPFFLAKYEMTQGQWERATGANPSGYFALAIVGGRMVTGRNPVENVSWSEAGTLLGHYGFVLPTGAQWEYACRAGTTTTWWTGNDVASLAGAANIADSCLRAHTSGEWLYEPSLDDGQVAHAPVGSFRPNAFGLHDTIGNVAEWTREPWTEPPGDAQPGEGEQAGGYPGLASFYGGGWSSEPSLTTSAHRERSEVQARQPGCGLRAARRLQRDGG